MKERERLASILLIFITILVVGIATVRAQKTPPDKVTLKIEGAMMAPVTFSHGTHAKSTDCLVCHHKDKNAKEPASCGSCHLPKEVKESAPPAMDAFHKQCQVCHKEMKEKEKTLNIPTACNECHKK